VNTLEPVPDPPGLSDDDRADDEPYELRRPRWWRWVAIVVIAGLVVATPFAYVLSRLLR
jgi:hypothetical protein